MSEAALQKAVTDLCGYLGLRWYHAYQPKFDPAGWPDLVICGVHHGPYPPGAPPAHGILFRELKRAGEDPTPGQLAWGHDLIAAGLSWDVWRPADLHSGRIQKELEAIR
jgi:hypothetical protein